MRRVLVGEYQSPAEIPLCPYVAMKDFSCTRKNTLETLGLNEGKTIPVRTSFKDTDQFVCRVLIKISHELYVQVLVEPMDANSQIR